MRRACCLPACNRCVCAHAAHLRLARNPDISTTLVGMASSEVVGANVDAVLQALGAAEPPPGDAAASARVMAEVQRILAPVKDISWPSGRPENQ